MTIEASQPDPSNTLVRPAALDKDSSGSSNAAGRDVGDALRSAYQQTVEEDVPDEMLNLLGRLS